MWRTSSRENIFAEGEGKDRSILRAICYALWHWKMVFKVKRGGNSEANQKSYDKNNVRCEIDGQENHWGTDGHVRIERNNR